MVVLAVVAVCSLVYVVSDMSPIKKRADEDWSDYYLRMWLFPMVTIAAAGVCWHRVLGWAPDLSVPIRTYALIVGVSLATSAVVWLTRRHLR